MNFKSFLIGAVFITTPLVANAIPITGELGIAGVLSPTCSAPGTCNLGNATGLDFGSNGAADGPMAVTFATDDFAADGLGFGDVGSIADFVFNPAALPVSPLWTITGNATTWTFSLETLIIDSQFSGPNGQALVLFGTGSISAAGFDTTMGEWSLSADSANPNGAVFSWSSTTVASEPTILLLFGLGLVALLRIRKASF